MPIQTEEISSDWFEGQPKKEYPHVPLEADTYESVLRDALLLKDRPIDPKYIKPGGPTTVDKILFSFQPTVNKEASVITVVSLKWGDKAGLQKLVKTLDPKGFTKAIQARASKDRKFALEYINSLIGRYYMVTVDPAATANWFSNAMPIPTPQHVLDAQAKEKEEAAKNDFTTMPDKGEDEIPFA